ncbi:hypothetical protein ACOMHN_056752 [Nucella lapillus]
MAGCRPLFLGSDLLRSVSEWDKNLWRVHARFAKLGLATKLVFKNCRIDGLRKGDEAYFYGVRGLFRVVFEFLPFAVQQECLRLLTDVWMKTSAELQPQLEAKYEVSLQNLVLGQDLPASAAAAEEDIKDDDSDDGGESDDKTPLPPSPLATDQTLKDTVRLPFSASGQNTSLESASAVSLEASEGCFQEPSDKAAARDWGSQRDLSFMFCNSLQEGGVVFETVCKLCRIRWKMMEREKAEVERMIQLSKKSKPQWEEGGEGACVVGHVSVDRLAEGRVVSAQTKTDSVGAEVMDVDVQPAAVSIFLEPPSPDSDTSVKSAVPVYLVDDLHSKNRKRLSLTRSQQDAQGPDTDTRVVPSAGSNQSNSARESCTQPPQQLFRKTAERSKTGGTEKTSMDVTEYDSGWHRAQKFPRHVQTQTDRFGSHGGTGSFSKEDSSTSGLQQVNTFVASDPAHALTDPETFCQQLRTRGGGNDPQVLTDTARYTELQAEKGEEDPLQAGSVDVAGLVQSWIKEVHRLKLLLRNKGANSSLSFQNTGDVVEDAVPDADAAARASHLQAVGLETLNLLLDFFLRGVSVITTSSDVSAVSEILTLLVNAAENSAKFISAPQDWQVTPPLKLRALSVFGAWLGEEFRHFRPAIFQRVTAFKQRHISNLSGLPSAAEIVTELFPPCMVQLISAWTGLAESQKVEAMEADHCYHGGGGASSAVSQQQNRAQFSLMQLVLELLNNSLVSGIAHVVFCKL